MNLKQNKWLNVFVFEIQESKNYILSLQFTLFTTQNDREVGQIIVNELQKIAKV